MGFLYAEGSLLAHARLVAFCVQKLLSLSIWGFELKLKISAFSSIMLITDIKLHIQTVRVVPIKVRFKNLWTKLKSLPLLDHVSDFSQSDRILKL